MRLVHLLLQGSLIQSHQEDRMPNCLIPFFLPFDKGTATNKSLFGIYLHSQIGKVGIGA